MGAFAALTIILGAVYMLRSYQAIMLGEKKSNEVTFGSLADTDKAVLIIVCLAVVIFGVYPKPLNDLAEPAVKALLMNLK
jgi:NADH-quinone oxidoreductase subunit M